jgi:hypothetical protein
MLTRATHVTTGSKDDRDSHDENTQCPDQLMLGECSDILSDGLEFDPDSPAATDDSMASASGCSDHCDVETQNLIEPAPVEPRRELVEEPAPVEPPKTESVEPAPAEPDHPVSSTSSDTSECRPCPEVLITRVAEPILVDSLPRIESSPQSTEASQDPAFTEEVLRSAASVLRETGEIPPDEMVLAVRGYLREKVMTAIMAQDYDEAERWKELVNRLASDELEEKRQQEDQKARLRHLEERVQATKHMLAEVHVKWNEKMVSFENEKRGKFAEMQARHEQEVAGFRQHWNEPTTLMAFTKPSTQLMLIRKQQRLSALADDFARAKELKRRGDELERQETAAAERKASASMKVMYTNLLRKHAQESQHTQMNWERQFTYLISERDGEIEKVELALQQLELKKNEAKGGKPRMTPPISRMTSGSAMRSSTARKMSELKTGTSNQKLPLAGVGCPRVKSKRAQRGTRRRGSIAGSAL